MLCFLKPQYNPYEEVTNCFHKYYAFIYLKEVKQLDYEELAKLFHWQVSTVRTYGYTYRHYLPKAKEMFEVTIINQLQNPNNYDLEETDKYFYFVKFYDENKKFLTSKVGITERSPKERLREHFRSNTPYSKLNACYLIIDRLYKCPCPPKAIENYAKGLLMIEHELVGNDQFPDNIDFSKYDEEVKKYFEKFSKNY